MALTLVMLITAIKALDRSTVPLLRTWHSYRRIGVSVTVASGSPAVTALAKIHGLNAMLISSTEYRAYFKALSQHPHTGWLGFFNGDTVFDIHELNNTLSQLKAPTAIATGLRTNVRACGRLRIATISSKWIKTNCKTDTFSQWAQDYFFFTRDVLDFLLSGTNMPPSRLGGVVFDNWLSSRPVAWRAQNTSVQPVSIDASSTLNNYHLLLEEGPGLLQSHRSAASAINRDIHRPGGGYSDYLCNEPIAAMYYTSSAGIQRRCPSGSDPGALCYTASGCWWP